jgi:hypothetical protein
VYYKYHNTIYFGTTKKGTMWLQSHRWYTTWRNTLKLTIICRVEKESALSPINGFITWKWCKQ